MAKASLPRRRRQGYQQCDVVSQAFFRQTRIAEDFAEDFAEDLTEDLPWIVGPAFRWCRNFFAARLFVIGEPVLGDLAVGMMSVGKMPVGKTSVAKTFAKRPLQQRIIALAAAYAIALASLIASFGAAQAAAEAAAQPDTFICHASAAERPTPTSDDSSGKTCVDCCIGCVAAVPAAVPPATSVAIIRQISVIRLEPLAHRVLIASAASSAHRSRGPPPAP
ncbi:MAG: hypothetical protein WBD11_13675 [Xanthobacteraceae bacterium]